MEKNNNTLYDELMFKKGNGEKLDFSQLTERNFIQLWYKEQYTLKRIAELFGVSEYRVSKLKNNWGLTIRKLIRRELSEELTREYAMLKKIDELRAMKEIERAKNKIELTVGEKYDNALQCFAYNGTLYSHAPQYKDIFKAVSQLVASKNRS